MKLVLSLLVTTSLLLVHAVEACLLVYAVLSWFPPQNGREGPIRLFFRTVGDAVTAPVRAFLSRFEFARRSPIDLSFLVTVLLLSFLSTILSSL